MNWKSEEDMARDVEENEELYQAIADTSDEEMTETIQETVEVVDNLLQEALQHANMYTNHEEVRPSAIRSFDKVQEARKELDKIDERDFNDE